MTGLNTVLWGDVIPQIRWEELPPEHRFDLTELRRISAPPAPPDFETFWEARFQRATSRPASPELTPSSLQLEGLQVWDVRYRSTDDVEIGGWLTVPAQGPVRSGLVVGHGYGGRTGPEPMPLLSEAAILYPCCRGLSRSVHPRFSSDPSWHVLHEIENPDRYIHGGCVEDIWLAVSALLELFPEVKGRIGYSGTSFSGGIGALALACDKRVARAHLAVPSFGHYPLRLRIPTRGSGAAVQRVWQQNANRLLPTLALHDAATASKSIRIPIHCACAISDPVVTPPGQFAIYNALGGPKELFVLSHGHSPSPLDPLEAFALASQVVEFFRPLGAAVSPAPVVVES